MKGVQDGKGPWYLYRHKALGVWCLGEGATTIVKQARGMKASKPTVLPSDAVEWE